MVASVIGLFIVSNYPDASKIMPLAIMAGTLLLSAVWIVQLIASGKICVDSRPTVDWAVTRRLLIAFGCLAFMLLGVSTVGFFFDLPSDNSFDRLVVGLSQYQRNCVWHNYLFVPLCI
ncbi:MAG: hypothetical protein LRY49_10470 [Burkholderiaceae bacterium]|nr:hypothetical protein [Burkholderiaceae bacterium]